MQGMDELRSFNAKRRNASAWVRQQVREAAMRCQVAAEATSEVAKVGAMLLNGQGPTTGGIPPQSKDASIIFQKDNGEEAHNPSVVDSDSNSEMDEFFEFNTNSSSGLQIGSQVGSISGPSSKLEDHLISQLSKSPQDLNSDKHESCPPNPNGFALDNDPMEFDDWEDTINDPAVSPAGGLLRTPSSGSGRQIDVGMDTSSVSSWEFVRDAQTNDVEEEEDDILCGISDAESLNMMLRDCDPFGCNGCSNLVNEFLSLHLSSAASSSSADQVLASSITPTS